MRKIVVLIAVFFILLSLCGCTAALVGGGVAGGVAIGSDRARIEKDGQFKRAWKITYATLKDMGRITAADEKTGKIKAIIQEAKVGALVVQVTPKVVRVDIKARKHILPDMNVAMDIINKINKKL